MKISDGEEGFGKVPSDTSTFIDITKSVKIGLKRTYQQSLETDKEKD